VHSNRSRDRQRKGEYRDALRQYLEPSRSKLSEDSQRRLEANPLRVLDSKDPRDIEAAKNAPPALEFLSDKSRGHFERVTSLLRQAGASFVIDGTLVRGI